MSALREDRGGPGVSYFQGVVGMYLTNRSIIYTNRGREVVSKVPQGSVLGPLFWDLAYDEVLQTPMPLDSALTCYPEMACVASIRGLRLELSLEKTDHGASPAE